MVPATGELPEVAADSAHDLTAFADLFGEQRIPALRLAFALTGDAGLAEDVVAEAFDRTYERWSKGAVDNPVAYVRRAVVNEVRSTFRRLAVRRRHAAQQRAVEPSASFPGDRLGDAEMLRIALMTLTTRQRAVVVLRIVEDLSEREVATVLRCSEGTVRSHLSRGLARLRTALESRDGGPDA